MKVKELIEELKKFDSELEVGICEGRHDLFGDVGHMEEKEVIVKHDWDRKFELFNQYRDNPKKKKKILGIEIYTREVMGR